MKFLVIFIERIMYVVRDFDVMYMLLYLLELINRVSRNLTNIIIPNNGQGYMQSHNYVQIILQVSYNQGGNKYLRFFRCRPFHL